MDSLRERRLRAGLTQGELARRSGVAQPNIAAYETGRRAPSAATWRRLEIALRPAPREALARHRDEVVEILSRYGMTQPRVFGSAATAIDAAANDLDLLVDAADDLDLLDIVDAGAELEALLGVSVDLVTSRSLRTGHEILTSAQAL